MRLFPCGPLFQQVRLRYPERHAENRYRGAILFHVAPAHEEKTRTAMRDDGYKPYEASA